MLATHVICTSPTLSCWLSHPRRGRLSACALSLVGALTAGASPASAEQSASAPHCTEVYDPSASLPPLPEADGADVSGDAGVVIYLHEDRAAVELDGCFYLVDRALEIDASGLDFVTLLFELPERSSAQVYVTANGALLETLDASGPMLSYVMDGSLELGFEIAAPGSFAPTGPTVITKPSGNPKPQ